MSVCHQKGHEANNTRIINKTIFFSVLNSGKTNLINTVNLRWNVIINKMRIAGGSGFRNYVTS